MSISEFSPDDLRTLIYAGAWIDRPDTKKAAVHLLNFTKLPDQKVLRKRRVTERVDWVGVDDSGVSAV